VLLSGDRAEHVPGCNMAFRRSALQALGGFDPVFTSAGDDVDVCWKLLDRGEQIGFAPAAQVRHHRRATVSGFLRQQRGYGRAEKVLSGAHPHRFNRLGQARWRGFIYGGPRLLPALLRPVIYHGPVGSAPFQPVWRRPAERAAGHLSAVLPFLLVVAIVATALGLLWPPALLAAALVAFTIGATGVSAAMAPVPRGEPRPLAFRGLVGFLHVVQPVVRTWARLRRRRHDSDEVALPVWVGDRWTWLLAIEQQLKAKRCAVRIGGPHDSWDLEARIGVFARCRLVAGVVWGWEPRWTRHCGVRLGTLMLGGVGIAGVFFAPIAAGITLATVATVALMELIVMRRILRSVIDDTTAGAQVRLP
jgi:hypothetical protein